MSRSRSLHYPVITRATTSATTKGSLAKGLRTGNEQVQGGCERGSVIGRMISCLDQIASFSNDRLLRHSSQVCNHTSVLIISVVKLIHHQ